MRNTQATLIAFLLGAVAAGCDGSTPEVQHVGTSQARLVMAVQGSGSASLRVIASDDVTSAVVIDRTIDVHAGSAAVLDVDVAPSSYTIRVDVNCGDSGDQHLGSGSARAVLEEGVTTEIRLTAEVDGEGSDASANVEIGVDGVPRIYNVKVTLGGDTHEIVEIHADAVDPDGDALTFFWSGPGLDGAVQGSATLTLPKAAVAGSGVVRVVAQDPHGATAVADVALVIAEGGAQGTVAASADVDASSQACLEAQAACNVACAASFGVVDTGANASCVADCGLALASCDTP